MNIFLILKKVIHMKSFVVISTFFVLTFKIEASQRVYLVQPDFSETTIGFKLKPDELDDYYSRMVDVLSTKLKRDVSRLRTSTISDKKVDSATFFVFKILDYYVTYGSLGLRRGHMKSLLLKYSSENGYAFPKRSYFTNVNTPEHWGDNTPFEYAIATTFDNIGNVEKFGRMDSTFLQKSIEEILDYTFDCGYYSALLWPDLSEERMRYNSEPEEIFNFVHHLADLCGNVMMENVDVLRREDLDSMQNCVKNIVKISFDLIEETMDFSIVNSATDTVIYHCQIALNNNTSDWNENDVFSRKIESVFSRVKEKFKKDRNR